MGACGYLGATARGGSSSAPLGTTWPKLGTMGLPLTWPKLAETSVEHFQILSVCGVFLLFRSTFLRSKPSKNVCRNVHCTWCGVCACAHECSKSFDLWMGCSKSWKDGWRLWLGFLLQMIEGTLAHWLGWKFGERKWTKGARPRSGPHPPPLRGLESLPSI